MRFLDINKKQVNIFGFRFDTKYFVISMVLYACAIMILLGLTLFGIDVSWYGVMVGTAFLVAIVITSHFCSYRGLSKDYPYDLIFWIFPFAIVGARLHYCFCNFEAFQDNLLKIIYVWDGGIAVHGGIAGGLVGLIICCLVYKKKVLNTVDAVVPALALGQCIGRIGCVFGECCYGKRVIDTFLQWVPLSIQVDGVWHFATNLYESIFDFINFVVLTILCRRCKTVGVPTFVYVAVYGVVRFILEMFRDDSQIMRVWGMPVAQLISVGMIIIGVVGLVVLKVVNTHKKSKESEAIEETN